MIPSLVENPSDLEIDQQKKGRIALLVGGYLSQNIFLVFFRKGKLQVLQGN